MRIKSIIIVIVFCFFTLPVFSLVLPDGTDAAVSDVKEREDGSIEFVSLIEPTDFTTSVGKIKLSDLVYFHPNGKIHHGRLLETQQIPTPLGKIKIGCSGRSVGVIGFYPSGKLMAATLALPQIITSPQGKVKIEMFELYENGTIKRVKLSENHIIKTPLGNLKIHREMKFFLSGKLEEIVLYEKTAIKKKSYRKNYAIQFYENGKMKNKVVHFFKQKI